MLEEIEQQKIKVLKQEKGNLEEICHIRSIVNLKTG